MGQTPAAFAEQVFNLGENPFFSRVLGSVDAVLSQLVNIWAEAFYEGESVPRSVVTLFMRRGTFAGRDGEDAVAYTLGYTPPISARR